MVPSWSGCYWGYGDRWHYDPTCWENRRGSGLLGANWEARQLWGLCNLNDLMESSRRGCYSHTNELWPFQSLYQVYRCTSLGGRTGRSERKDGRSEEEMKTRWANVNDGYVLILYQDIRTDISYYVWKLYQLEDYAKFRISCHFWNMLPENATETKFKTNRIKSLRWSSTFMWNQLQTDSRKYMK